MSRKMTEDERQAERILRQWIADKTGVSNLERGMWKAGEELRRIGEAAHAVGVRVAIPADELMGLDLTRPVTITQEDS